MKRVAHVSELIGNTPLVRINHVSQTKRRNDRRLVWGSRLQIPKHKYLQLTFLKELALERGKELLEKPIRMRALD